MFDGINSCWASCAQSKFHENSGEDCDITSGPASTRSHESFSSRGSSQQVLVARWIGIGDRAIRYSLRLVVVPCTTL